MKKLVFYSIFAFPIYSLYSMEADKFLQEFLEKEGITQEEFDRIRHKARRGTPGEPGRSGEKGS